MKDPRNLNDRHVQQQMQRKVLFVTYFVFFFEASVMSIFSVNLFVIVSFH